MNHSISPERFNEVVRAYGGYVYTIAFNLLGNPADAEDAAQETFIKAYKRLHTFDEQRGLKNWLCTIALNTARDFYRRSNRGAAAATLEGEGAAVPEGGEFSSRIGARLDAVKMLSILDINYRSVMVLYYMEQCSVREIAAMMKKSENVVKVWLFRARKILMEKFGDSVV
ncbi:MAG: RNA polymerase sigma factor [Chitinispirillaceae bacterium]|nr:RNA polymerase sigma factor [Chitinispirillaceae bacterium]